jgi:hypothetical protein
MVGLPLGVVIRRCTRRRPSALKRRRFTPAGHLIPQLAE